MSPFLIFAISLTIAYAIYYAVMITRDLYGKKEEAKSNEDVFDISNITEEEAAVAVNESDGGFSVADKQYDTSFQDGTSYDEGYGMGTEDNGLEMFGNFFKNLGKGNVSGLSLAGLVTAAFLTFGRFGWLGKIAGAMLGMMLIGNNSNIKNIVSGDGGQGRNLNEAETTTRSGSMKR